MTELSELSGSGALGWVLGLRLRGAFGLFGIWGSFLGIGFRFGAFRVWDLGLGFRIGACRV